MKKLKYAVHAYAWTPRMMRARQLSVLLLLSAGIVPGSPECGHSLSIGATTGGTLPASLFFWTLPPGTPGLSSPAEATW